MHVCGAPAGAAYPEKLTTSPGLSARTGSETQGAKLRPVALKRMLPVPLGVIVPPRVCSPGIAACQTTCQSDWCVTPAVAQPAFGWVASAGSSVSCGALTVPADEVRVAAPTPGACT